MGDVILPGELIRPIVEHVQHEHDLYTLSKCTRFLHAEANRCLYKSFTDSDKRTQTLFLATVSAHPRLAALVQNFHIYFTSFDAQDDLTQITSISHGLRNMTNLRELSIKRGERATYDWRLLISHLLECISPRVTLEKFLWSTDSTDSDTKVIRFLNSHHAQKLKHLRWTCLDRSPINAGGLHYQLDRRIVKVKKIDDYLIAPSACPDVVVFEGNRSSITAFLPGRKVRRLVWLSDKKWPNKPGLDPAHGLYEALHLLRSMTYVPFFSSHTLPCMFQHLQALQVLEIFDIFSEGSLAPLCLLPHLSILIFSLPEVDSCNRNTRLPLDRQEELIPALFETCHALERVDVALEVGDSMQSAGNTLYRRWEEGVLQLDFISFEDVQMDVSHWWK